MLQIVYVSMCCNYGSKKKKKIAFRRRPSPQKWLDSRTDPADSGDRTALWWGDSETCGKHSHPQKKSSNANLNLSQHIANRVAVPLNKKVGISMVLTWGGRLTKKNLSLVHPSPWERKVEGSNCKKPFILPFGDGNEMFLSVNWFATVTLRWFWFEPGTWRFRNWKRKRWRDAQGFETLMCT